MSFFQGKQSHFFRPLYRSTREKYAYAIKAIYERLYGPDAAFSRRFDRQALLETVERAIVQAPAEILPVRSDEPTEAGDLDPAACVRELEEHGWLETYTDASSVTKVWRLTPVGKKFARTLWEVDRQPLRTRHRHMRSCAAALKNYVATGDADDLLDAQTYAEQVVEDLSTDIEAFRMTLREVTRATKLRDVAVENFTAFLNERFRKEHAPRLVADSALRLKGAISESLEMLRALPEARLEQFESQLKERVVLEKTAYGYQVLAIAERIERLVRNAVETKIPELTDGFNQYIARMTSLIRQTAAANAAGPVDPAKAFAQDLRAASDEAREAALERLAEAVGTARVRLWEPAEFRFRLEALDALVPAASVDLVPDPESVLQAEIRRAYDEHLSFAESDALAFLVQAAAARGGRVRLSEFQIDVARDLLLALAAETSVLSRKHAPVEVRAVGAPAATPYFTTHDLEFVLTATAA